MNKEELQEKIQKTLPLIEGVDEGELLDIYYDEDEVPLLYVSKGEKTILEFRDGSKYEGELEHVHG